ncbi:diacylglycerol/lipid kinase family protein [Trueperella bialowiezensis]|uniref:Diacylglycerol kinase n=1 Tax=Trueperella bialowiezensis TaxID=312285 RepID=A0A3S4WF13_9ACTO|nr:diacylglycerol kinase family protein [Trueperella bialowiezensis]VEI12429.1 Diacylglycerol kinase [Trueperella bialowiezensis]
MKIAVALNPAAGKGRSLRYRDAIASALDLYPIEAEWISAPNRPGAMDAERLISRGIDALVVVGGDGLIHDAVNAIGDSHLPLGIIAAGSGNDIAREFGLPIHSVHDSMHQIAASLLTGRSRCVDVVDIQWSGGSERALAIVSVGIDADTNHRTNNLSWPKGNLRYVRGLVGSLLNYRPYGVQITMNGDTVAGSMTLLSIANTRYFGGGFCIAPQAVPDDGLLDVVVTPGFRYADIATRLSKLLIHKHTSDSQVHVYRTREIQVEHAPQHGAPLPVIMADGEEICPAPATIRVLPKALRLVL